MVLVDGVGLALGVSGEGKSVAHKESVMAVDISYRLSNNKTQIWPQHQLSAWGLIVTPDNDDWTLIGVPGSFWWAVGRSRGWHGDLT
jgi:hypothetical protein